MPLMRCMSYAMRNAGKACGWLATVIILLLLSGNQTNAALSSVVISPDKAASFDTPPAKDAAPGEPQAPPSYDVQECIGMDMDGMELSKPSRIFFDPEQKEIYVTDSGHARILVYTHDFYPLLTIGASERISAPMGLAADRDGRLYIAQGPGRGGRHARISVLNPALRWEEDIVLEGFEGAESFRPKNIALDGEGRIYVAGDFPGVVVWRRGVGLERVLRPMDSLGKGEPETAIITDVAVNGNGDVYLLSEEMGRVYVHTREGAFRFKFGEKGGGPGKLSRPRGLAVDDGNGLVYVVDYMRHCVNIYSFDGRYVAEFGGKGWLLGWLQFPSDVAVDADGRVLVADTFNNRVQVLRHD